MQRAVCEQCGHWQPGDWAAGDLCVACGAAVRREVRCAWCAEWTPSGKFCRGCACELVNPEHYGAVRMLKHAGVDRFILAQRLRELDPEQAANLGRIYNAQLAVVARRVEEVRLCESGLLQKGFARRLEEELVPQLPLEKEPLAALAAGPAGPFDARPQLLPDIAASSPLAITRTLAAIALVRRGQFKGFYGAVCQALGSGDAEVALEAALAFAHWRVRLSPYGLWRSRHPSYYEDGTRGIDAPRLAEVAGAVPPGSPLRPWAAAAVALAWCREYGIVPEHEPGGRPGETEPPEWLREELRAGLSSREPDLRFTCAMALGEDGVVAEALRGDDPGQQEVARICLAKHNSPAIASLLKDGPEEVRVQLIEDLRAPLPQALVEPVCVAAERADARHRGRAVRLLLKNLDPRLVERLIRLAQRQRAPEVLKLLLEIEELPAAAQVVRAAIQGGWFEALAAGQPEHVDFTDDAVAQLAAKGNAEVAGTLLGIAERQLEKLGSSEPPGGPGRGAGVARFLVRVAFGGGEEEVRERAYGTLEYRDERQWKWLSPDGLRELFGNAAGFLEAAVPVLEDEQALRQMRYRLLTKLLERWAEVGEVLVEARRELKRLVGVLQEKAAEDDDAARLLVKVAVSSPEAALPAVTALLKEAGSKWALRDLAGDLLAGYDTLAGTLNRKAPLAANLADALAGLLAEVTLEYRWIPALELLARLARDHGKLRRGVAARTAEILKDRDWGDTMLKPALDSLAEAVDFKEAPKEPAPEEPPVKPQLPNEVLDHTVMLPDCPLKTLAEYCAFMKAMDGAADPMAVMAAHGLTVESMVQCVDRWGELIAGSDQLSRRYAALLAP